jgi:hypothetical protein
LKFFVILKFNYDILTFDVNLTFNLTFLWHISCHDTFSVTLNTKLTLF